MRFIDAIVSKYYTEVIQDKTFQKLLPAAPVKKTDFLARIASKTVIWESDREILSASGISVWSYFSAFVLFEATDEQNNVFY